jgi:hypothetical protein
MHVWRRVLDAAQRERLDRSPRTAR